MEKIHVVYLLVFYLFYLPELLLRLRVVTFIAEEKCKQLWINMFKGV